MRRLPAHLEHDTYIKCPVWDMGIWYPILVALSLSALNVHGGKDGEDVRLDDTDEDLDRINHEQDRAEHPGRSRR